MGCCRGAIISFHDPLTLELSLREKLAYGVGDFSSNLMLCVGILYLLRFYTDELGMPAHYGRVIFLVARFLTTPTNVLIGVLLGSRRSIGTKDKFGPFILYASFPVTVITSAQFLATDFTLAVKAGLATVLFILFGLFYSLMNCSYGAMVPAITENPHERAQLVTWHQGDATIGLLLYTVGFMPIQALFVSSSSLGCLITTLIFSVCRLFNVWWYFSGVKERYIEVMSDHHKPSILKSLRTIFRSPPLLMLCVVNLCTLATFNIKLAVQVYYTRYVLNNIHLLSWTEFFSIECILVEALLVPATVRRFGKKQIYLGGPTLWAISDVLNFFWGNTSFLFVTFSCMTFFETAFVNSLNQALVPDTVDCGEWKTGVRAGGSMHTGYAFSHKISAALADFLPGIMLTQIGYIPSITQSNAALSGLHQLIFLWPCGLAIIAAFTMGLFYKLSEARFAFIIEEISRRKKNDTLSNPVATKSNTSAVNV